MNSTNPPLNLTLVKRISKCFTSAALTRHLEPLELLKQVSTQEFSSLIDWNDLNWVVFVTYYWQKISLEFRLDTDDCAQIVNLPADQPKDQKNKFWKRDLFELTTWLARQSSLRANIGFFSVIWTLFIQTWRRSITKQIIHKYSFSIETNWFVCSIEIAWAKRSLLNTYLTNTVSYKLLRGCLL